MDFFKSNAPSMDFFSKKAEGLKAGLTEGSSKLLDGAKESSKGGGLFGNISSGISKISQQIGGAEENGAVPAGGASGGATGGPPQGAQVGPGGMPLPTPGAQAGPNSMMPQRGGMGAMGGAGGMGHTNQQMQQGAQHGGGHGVGGHSIVNNPPHPATQQHQQQHQQQYPHQQQHQQQQQQQQQQQSRSPMPQKPRVMKVHRDAEEIYEDSDADSQATEGADDMHMQQLGDYDAMGPGGMGGPGGLTHSGSMGSELSWASSDDHMLDDISRDARDFMKNFVYKMFDPEGLGIDSMDKARFGDLLQHEAGRLWFARYVNAQRANKVVSEQTFYQLVQYFALVLFECNEADDFVPAKTLMNMCFTFYYEADQQQHGVGGAAYKHYLYSYLKDQAIWQSLRFWNAAFFDAVQRERMRRPLPTSQSANATAAEDKKFQENIVFGQLGTFTCNMRSFGLKKEMVQEFIRKQSTLASLREEQIQMLRENTERWEAR